jgi:hypothetical protein
MMRKALFLLLIVLALACGGVEATKVGEVELVEVPTPTRALVEAPAVYKTGDIITIGDYELIVFDVKDLEPGQLLKPDEGNKLIAVEISFVNIGTGPIQVISITQMSVKDEQGYKYERDFVAASLIDTDVDGELAPGENVRGFVGFQVPQEAGPLIFVFEPGLLTTGKVFVELESHLSKVVVE